MCVEAENCAEDHVTPLRSGEGRGGPQNAEFASEQHGTTRRYTACHCAVGRAARHHGATHASSEWHTQAPKGWGRHRERRQSAATLSSHRGVQGRQETHGTCGRDAGRRGDCTAPAGGAPNRAGRRREPWWARGYAEPKEPLGTPGSASLTRGMCGTDFVTPPQHSGVRV